MPLLHIWRTIRRKCHNACPLFLCYLEQKLFLLLHPLSSKDSSLQHFLPQASEGRDWIEILVCSDIGSFGQLFSRTIRSSQGHDYKESYFRCLLIRSVLNRILHGQYSSFDCREQKKFGEHYCMARKDFFDHRKNPESNLGPK